MRKRRTKARMELLSRQITRILERDHPQSVRHVFYRMTDPRLPEHVDKTEAGYATVQNLLVKLRRQALIPYGWIADATRQGYFTTTFNHPADAIEHVASLYRRNYWTTAPVYVEVWCESRSLAGVIVRDCKKYAVPLYPSGGFTSLSFAWSAAENIRANAGDRPTHLIYVGDYDPAGVLIDKKIEDELRGHLEGYKITFCRIAINREQIELMGLPTKPPKKGDKRGGWSSDQGTVEAEAMPAGVMRRLLREAIEQFIDPRQLAVLEEAEASERWTLLGEAMRLRSIA